jgi:Ca-activated chloride channel family protein
MKSRQIPSEPFGLEAWLEKSRVVLPLRGLSVRADITAGFADVEVDQLFEQNNAQPLDCRFLFPLPADSAVYRCEMRVNGRVVMAKTEKRSEARKLFKQAKARGWRAALTESERDNLFTLQLGNLQPGDVVLMRFAYLQPVQRLRERRTLRIPVNPGVRYIPGEPLLRENSGVGPIDDTDLVPDASRITTPRIAPDHPDAASLHATVRLRGAGDFTDSASSPSHPIVIRKEGEDLVAALAIDGNLPDRDFVFTYNEKTPATPVIRAWLDENRRGLLEIRLPASDPTQDSGVASPSPATAVSPSDPSRHSPQVTGHNTSTPIDVYFLLDRSGSMGGDNWLGACKALAAFVPRLHPDTRVWLALFESTVRDYEAKLIRAADIDFGADGSAIYRIGVDGGTELVAALKHLGTKIKEHSNGRPATALVITDGQVGNEEGAASAAKKLGCPVHVLGIAMTANDGLDAIAKETGGRSIFLAPGEDIAGAVERFASVLRAPVVTGLTLPAGWTTVDDAPMRDLCDADDLVIPISATRDARDLDVGGRAAEGAAWLIVPERQDLPSAGLMWARARIRHLDATKRKNDALALAKEFNLLSNDAAFIAWDEAEQVPVAQSEIVQPGMEVRSYVSACMAPPPDKLYNVVQEDSFAMRRGMGSEAPPKPRTRRRKSSYSAATLLLAAPFALLALPVAIVAALLDRVQSARQSNLRPEVAQLLERLRQLVEMLYPGQSYPHEVRDALKRIQTIIHTLEKSAEDKHAALQQEAVDQVDRLLQSLREHARQRKQELHDQARHFADLEHTAVLLSLEFQSDVVATQLEADAATM